MLACEQYYWAARVGISVTYPGVQKSMVLGGLVWEVNYSIVQGVLVTALGRLERQATVYEILCFLLSR